MFFHRFYHSHRDSVEGERHSHHSRYEAIGYRSGCAASFDNRRGGDFRGRGEGAFFERGRGGGRSAGGFDGGDFPGRGRGEGGLFDHGRGEGRHGGHFGHRHGPEGRREGEYRTQRLLEHGELRLVLLALVARKPSHGYELIKAIEQASFGLYVPSPGVIYPTLSLLVDQDFLDAISPEGQSRKNYQITANGQAELAKNQPLIDSIFARLEQIGKRQEGSMRPGIAESVRKLLGLLRGNMMRTDLQPEQVERINAALLAAVKSIETELDSRPDADPR